MATSANGRLRVVSFNIQHGQRGDATGVDIALTGSVVAALKPDVLALQEVDVGVPRSAMVDEAAEVAAACGLDHLFAPATAVGGVGRYGNALCVRGSLDAPEVRRLPRRRFRSEPRSVGIARVRVDDVTVTVAATHLSIHREEVFDQLRACVSWLVARPGPWVLVGDLNLLPDEVVPTVEGAGLTLADTSVPTFPAASPRIRIDHVAVGGGLRIAAIDVAETPASDHRPLVVDLDVVES
ncbi:MAG TPA: endonuclease/exonuclease/phosphatase family protein [Acidimicrobiales bacterium]